jgi:acyl-CoA reductase-like NAD-dependent aldehyde dehydrogenase
MEPAPGSGRRNFITNVWDCDTLEKAHGFLSKQSSPQVTMENLVANQYVSHTSDSWIDSFDPKTGKVYGRVPVSTAVEVNAAIDVAGDAFKTWSKTSRAVRSGFLGRIAELIQKHHELFSVWESIDQGKTLARARIEVDRAISNFT